ncbi:MAG: MFS transporter, partial [Candidatus Lokiarchaeota archaeon]|nr:MFS transporter [Candidatus Lokiarchaeota archaeon]
GKFSDKFNRKYLLISSIPLYILGLFLLILASPNNLNYVILGILLYFLGFIINNLNTQFLVAENSNKSKGLIFGFMFFSYFGGTIAGSLFIILTQIINSRFYFMFFILLLVIEGIIFTFFISAQTTDSQNQIVPIKNLEKERNNLWVKILTTKTSRSILIFFTLDIFVYSISLSIYTGGLYDYYNLTKDDIAFIYLWFNIGNALFQIPAGRITDKIGNKTTLILSQLFGFGFFFMNILTVILWMNQIRQTIFITLSIGFILFALSVCTFIPAEQIIMTNLSEEQKAESYGIISFFRGIGLIPTGIIGGLIVENVHYIAPFIFSAIGIVVELLFLLKFFQD